MRDDLLSVRLYGAEGPSIVVLHGGPGAPGSAGPLAKALADSFCVVEPCQRWSSDVPLTVLQHIEDIATTISANLPGRKPAIIGESWGAMLGLAFASAHPARVSALVLMGCGTFDRGARARLQETLEERTSAEMRLQLAELSARIPDDADRVAHIHAITDPLYNYSRVGDIPVGKFDLKGHRESWNDMLRLQESGTYPSAFSSITCPVVMLHGSYDPHPGKLIRESLVPYIPQLEYHEFERCGHEPWAERYARDEFFSTLRTWLLNHPDPHHRSSQRSIQ